MKCKNSINSSTRPNAANQHKQTNIQIHSRAYYINKYCSCVCKCMCASCSNCTKKEKEKPGSS